MITFQKSIDWLIHVQENNFFKFNLTVKIELDDVVYYLRQVFHLLFF